MHLCLHLLICGGRRMLITVKHMWEQARLIGYTHTFKCDP